MIFVPENYYLNSFVVNDTAEQLRFTTSNCFYMLFGRTFSNFLSNLLINNYKIKTSELLFGIIPRKDYRGTPYLIAIYND